MRSMPGQAIGRLKPPGVEAHFIVAACENMVSEKAMRPGDILTASNGKTIEVGGQLSPLVESGDAARGRVSPPIEFGSSSGTT